MNELKGTRVAIIVTDDLRNAGDRWEDKECFRDRNWVSSRKPDDLPVFNREMVNLFTEAKGTRSEKRDAREVRP
jgi:protease I